MNQMESGVLPKSRALALVHALFVFHDLVLTHSGKQLTFPSRLVR